jgi:hypothetical protein
MKFKAGNRPFQPLKSGRLGIFIEIVRNLVFSKPVARATVIC